MKILLIYRVPISSHASTISEHVLAFPNYSKNSISLINTEFGFPFELDSKKFDVIVLHYSLFGYFPFRINDAFKNFLNKSRNLVKVAFFQDEYQYCKERFDFINKFEIDIIYSLFQPNYFQDVYLNNTCCKIVYHTLPGYVSNSLKNKANEYYKNRLKRKIDIGYRSRRLPFFMGKGSQEKSKIGDLFLEKSTKSGLICDISSDEHNRIYGENWYRFLSESKFTLGVEAGVSIVDLSGEVLKQVDKYKDSHPECKFSELHDNVLFPYEDNMFYRTISPRIFEAAAFKVCLILFPGLYSNLLDEEKHFIKLEKDFSNFNEVLESIKDDDLVKMKVKNTHEKLINSEEYTYSNFIKSFDSNIDTFIESN